MQVERKKIIKFALDFDIEDINTYAGYKGDLIVKITTKDIHTVASIRHYADELELKEIVVKQNPHIVEYEIFCVTPDKEVYHLKRDDIMDEVHAKHAPKKDVWNGSK
jgi:hypothetical protein